MKTSWLHVIHHNLFLADWLALRVFTASSLSASSFIVISFAFLIFVWSKLPCCCCQMYKWQIHRLLCMVFFLCLCFHVVSDLLLWILSKKGLKLFAQHLWINYNVFLNTGTPTATTRRHCSNPISHLIGKCYNATRHHISIYPKSSNPITLP